MKARALFLLMVVALLSLPALAAEPLVGTASVIDGDTIEIHGNASGFTGSTLPKAGNNAPGQMAHHGGAASNRLSRFPTGSGGRPFTATRVVAIAMVVS